MEERRRVDGGPASVGEAGSAVSAGAAAPPALVRVRATPGSDAISREFFVDELIDAIRPTRFSDVLRLNVYEYVHRLIESCSDGKARCVLFLTATGMSVPDVRCKPSLVAIHV